MKIVEDNERELNVNKGRPAPLPTIRVNESGADITESEYQLTRIADSLEALVQLFGRELSVKQ